MTKSSRIAKAQKGYSENNLKLSRQAHTKQAIEKSIHKEKHQQEKGEYIGDFVYGSLDGIITTFAIIAGVSGANFSAAVILVLGAANLLADGLSMGLGNYISTKSEKEYEERERKRELWEIENLPEGEKEEIRQIFKKKGFKDGSLEKVVEVISSNKDVWVDTMLKEELHIFPDKRSPIKSAVVTLVAFVSMGSIPIIPYVLNYFFPLFNNPFLVSIIITGLWLFVIGSLRTAIIGKSWWKAGLEMFLIGFVAALVAYYIGEVLAKIV